MANLRLFLLLAIGALEWSQATAAPLGLRGCNTDRIRAELAAGKLPSLIGCKPETVEPILQNYDYPLAIGNRVASSSIRAGRIVSQRNNDGLIYVDVSTGPERRSQSSDGDRADGRTQSSEQPPDRTGEAVGRFFGEVLREIAESPPRRRPPPVAPAPRPPAQTGPSDQLAEVLKIPTPVVPPPTNTQRPPAPKPEAPRIAPTPRPETVPIATTPVAQANATQRETQLAERAPPVAIDPVPDPAIEPEVPPPPPPPPPPPVRPSVFRIAIEGSSSLGEGDELRLVIRRDRRDGSAHLLALNYSDPRLLVSPPRTIDFGPDSPDEIRLPLRTAIAEGNENHDLRVTLASNSQSEVAQPNTVSAVILDRTPWWQKLLDAIASLPPWVAAVAAAALAAGAAPLLMPRATCSIGGGSMDLGPTPLKNSWPAMQVDAVIGEASFSIPSPLPIGRRTNAEPSPA